MFECDQGLAQAEYWYFISALSTSCVLALPAIVPFRRQCEFLDLLALFEGGPPGVNLFDHPPPMGIALRKPEDLSVCIVAHHGDPGIVGDRDSLKAQAECCPGGRGCRGRFRVVTMAGNAATATRTG